ncbi:MAG: toxin-antitoxin system protein [Candidatus Aenigmatarchaeota archaeon]
MNKKIPVTITLDSDLFEKFKTICEKNDVKVSTKINTLIKEWIEKNSKKDEL